MLLEFGSAITILFVLGLLAHNAIFKRYELASLRNIFLVGFIYFYSLTLLLFSRGSTAEALSTKSGRAGASVESLEQTVIWVATSIVTFLAVSTWAFRKKSLADKIPNFSAPLGSAMILGVAIAGAGLAFLIALVPPTGYIGLLSVQFRTGFASLAAALATYYLVSQRFNPLSWAIFIGVLVAAVLATTVGGIGRRSVLSVIMAVGVVAYFADFRFRSGFFKFTMMTAVGVAGFAFILAYSTVRHDQDDNQRLGAAAVQNRVQQIQTMFDLENMLNATDGVIYQDTSFNTGFIIDNYPQHHDYRYFRDFIYVVGLPIPRAIWDTKPRALGAEIMDHMSSPANLGPGIVGHGWAAGGPIGVIAFGAVFGVFIGVADRKIVDNPYNPWILAIFSSNLGNVLGLPRGDTALFTVQILASVTSAAVLIIVAKPIIGPVGRAMAPVLPPAWRKQLAHIHNTQQPHAIAPPDRPAIASPSPAFADNNWAALR